MLPIWVIWLQAPSTPAIAVAGLVIAASNSWLAYRRREDDPLDRCCEFFRRMVAEWTSAIQAEEQTGEPVPEWDDRPRWAQEARFLFGDDVASYDKPFDHHFSHLTNDDFVKPFEKHLRLGS